MVTIGGKDLIPKVIGTYIWSCIDDDLKIYTRKFINVLYFTYSSVNILSATALTESTNDYLVTRVLIKGNILFLIGFQVSTKGH